MQLSPNAVINLEPPTEPLSDHEIAERVTNFIQTFPITIDVWGPWQTTKSWTTENQEHWLHDWPDELEDQLKIIKASAFTDSFGKRRGETGSFVELKREYKNGDLGTNYCWNARFCIGYVDLPGVSNAIGLTIPTADQLEGCTTETIRSYLDFMVTDVLPKWAILRDIRFARRLRESGRGTWVEGRIPSAWMTYFSWEEVDKREIDLEQLADLVEVDRREDGIMATVPGTFEEPDMDIAVKLSDLTQMPEHQ